MIMKYYVSKIAQTNGDHEVHDESCHWLPSPEHRAYVGEYLSCFGAVLDAKKQYPQSDGCVHCCKPCHQQ